MPQKKRSPARQAFTAKVSETPRRVESRMAPPRRAERQHARPGAGIKRARGVMVPRGR